MQQPHSLNRRKFFKQASFLTTGLFGWSTGGSAAEQRLTAGETSTPVIIEAAINGTTTKEQNPNVPRVPVEIAAEGLRCLAAGAAVIHTHNDEPFVGGPPRHDPKPYIEAWKAILAERPDAILYPTMRGGAPNATIEDRSSHVVALAEAGVGYMAVVDPGTLNVGPVLAKGLPAAVDLVYQTTLADVRYMFDLCERLRLGPSMAIYEPGFLRVALGYWRAGRLPQGAWTKLFLTGEKFVWGLPPNPASLEAYIAMLKGTDLPWAVSLIGGDVVDSGMARLALERGGHVRVGLEDYAGPRRPTNEELVREVVALAKAVGRPVASCEQAASMLKLPLARARSAGARV